MPVEFVRKNSCIDIREQIVCDSTKLLMAYDGSGRRVSKTRMRKADGGEWETELVTHYTGIGTEVREVMRRSASPKTDVVVNMPQGLGRFGVEDASTSDIGFGAGYIPSTKFEWYLRNHLGSTMLVYGTSAYDDSYFSKYKGGVQAAYDYRAFGEQVDLEQKGDKVTENFTGKERDDETELNYFGARYLDPMLGLWISVDAARQYQNPYLYAGNNPIMRTDPDGNQDASAFGWDAFVRDMHANEVGVIQKMPGALVDAGEKMVDASITIGLTGVSIFAKDPLLKKGANVLLTVKGVYEAETPGDYIHAGLSAKGPKDLSAQILYQSTMLLAKDPISNAIDAVVDAVVETTPRILEDRMNDMYLNSADYPE